MTAYDRVLAAPGSIAARRALSASGDARRELIDKQLAYRELKGDHDRASDPARQLDHDIEALIAARGRAWAGRVAELVLAYEFHRGLVARVRLSGSAWVRVARELLSLAGMNLRDDAALALARSPRAAQLRWIDLSSNAIGEAGVAALAASPHLADAQFIGLEHNPCDPTPVVYDYDQVRTPSRPAIAAELERTHGLRPWLALHDEDPWPPDRDEVAISDAPARLAGEPILQATEALAAEVDALAERGATDLEGRAALWARRQRLLLELETGGVLEDRRASLGRLRGFPRLAAYHAAAMELRAYLASPERAAVFGDRPPPDRLAESRVSLDWFRLGRAPAVDAAPRTFLAWCEDDVSRSQVSFAASDRDEGEMFSKRLGRTWTLRYRREVGTVPVFFRTDAEGSGVGPDLTPAPWSFDRVFALTGNLVAYDQADRDTTWFVAFAACDRGATMLASRSVPHADRAGWLAALARHGVVVGDTYAAAGIVWTTAPHAVTIWTPDARIVRTRAELADVIAVSSIASDDHVDRAVRLHRAGGRAETLVVEHDEVARLDPTYGRFDLMESDGRWCAYCASSLARWLGVRFVDEAFRLPPGAPR